MEQLKNMKENLICCVQSQIADISHADTKELGEAIDMIKDLAEAIYYWTITEAMEAKDKHPQYQPMYYTPYYPEYYRDMDRMDGRMYYSSNGNMGGNRMYAEPMQMTGGMRDYREGRSPMSRRMYMESKEMHHGKEAQMKELENYMKELSQDVTEMIMDATPDEKMMLQQKLITLANKVTEK